MRNVTYNKNFGDSFFSYQGGDKDESGSFEYRFSTELLWNPINFEDFEVELLINSLLNRESNVYELRDNKNHTVGYVFPVSLLDSDSDFSEYRNINNYVYIAFVELLKRIPSIKEECEFFSDNFEENICVCVLHKPSINIPYPLSQCIHSLRKYGYSYFEENNRIRPIKGYDPNLFFKNRQKRIIVEFKEPSLYQNPMINSILRALPKADNLTHRFVLLYQVIETLFEEITSKKIHDEIKKFRRNQIPCSDFQECIKRISSERIKILEIFNCCKSLKDSDEAKQFKSSCMHLFDLIHYVPSKNEMNDIFYSFRNQMTHSFRKLYVYPEELAETIQDFELVILKIIETYPYK